MSHLEEGGRPGVLAEIMRRDLEILAGELVVVPEEDLWRTTGAVRNSVGNLALHMCGNLLHYVGAELGGTGYVRDRDAEFSRRNASRDELLGLVEDTRIMLADVLPRLPAARLADPMPNPPARFQGRSVEFFLLHLSSHLAYHLGQVNYLRRILASPADDID